MINDRPVDDPKLQVALDAIRAIMEHYDFPGAVMLVAPEEAAFSYKMDATWSALRKDRSLPLGFRFRANSAQTGKREAQRRVEGAMHTICQLSDFGEQTTAWMEDLKLMLRRAGLEFDHTPFGGKPLQHLATHAAAADPARGLLPKPPPMPATPRAGKPELSLAAEWASFEQTLLGADVSATQRRETRRGFYAGASSLFATMMAMLDPGVEETEADLGKMDALHEELLRFADDLKAGRA